MHEVLVLDASHGEAFQRLLADIYHETGSDPSLASADVLNSYLNDIINAQRIVTAARIGADLVGYATLLRQRSEAGAYAVVQMSVLFPHRFKGIGTSLLVALVELAREAGDRNLFLEVGENNPPARRLYEKMGFAYCSPFLHRDDNASPHALMHLTP